MTNYKDDQENFEQQENANEQNEGTPELEFASREELEQQLTAMEMKASEYRQMALRAQAELENVRKRAEREVEKASKFGVEQLLGDLLPVLDSLVHGLEGSTAHDHPLLKSMRHGMELTLGLLEKTLEKHGINVIAPERGDSFNPQFHEAISMQESPDAASNTVMEVLQKGYQLNGRVLRPARVIVAR